MSGPHPQNIRLESAGGASEGSLRFKSMWTTFLIRTKIEGLAFSTGAMHPKA